MAAEEELGVREWVNVAGTSAGAIVARLLGVGPLPRPAPQDVGGLDYRVRRLWRAAAILGGLRNAMRRRGLVRGEYFREWIASAGESQLGDADATFARGRCRDDLPAGCSADESETWAIGCA